MRIYILIETQEQGSELEGDNILGVYSTNERAEAEMNACEEAYGEWGHEYRIEEFVVDKDSWLKGGK